MNKINGFRKALALLLAVLIAVPALGLSAFALEPVYTQILTSSEYAESGDYWYDGYALADATGTEVYRYDAQYYLSDDADVLKITYTLNDEPVTELRTRADDADYFAYLYVLPAFNLLPTSPDGLEDGVYWYDKDGMVNYATKHYQESSLPRYTTADYYLSVDGTMLRRTYVHSSYGYSYTYHVDEFLDRPGTMCRFLRQAGVDPNAGFTKIPKSDEGLQTGDYWFDAAGLAERFGTYGQDYLDAEYYLSDDAGTLRVIQTDGIPSDYELSQGGLMGTYLHQVGVDPNAGFSLLPKSADGLADGSYWFDAAALAEIAGEYGSVYLNADYYLSDDGETIRMILFGSPSEYKKSEGGFLFTYLRQVGVDPNAGFTLLPKSAEGLSDGDYWYDAAALAALAGEYADMYQNADYYLSDDGNTLRIMANGQKLDFTTEDDGASTFFSFLHQVGGTPIEHFSLLPTSPDGLADGDYWFDAAGLAEAVGDATFASLSYYLSDDAQTIRFVYAGQNIDIAYTDKDADDIFPYLHRVGEAVMAFNLLPTSPDGLADDDYWFDAVGFAASVNQDAFLSATYYLSEDAQTLRIVLGGQNIEFSTADEEASLVFPYLHRADDPVVTFILLPTSEEGLADGTYWYNAAGIAAAAGTDDYLNATYYLSDDGQTLRIRISGHSMDVPQTAEYAAFYFAFLRRAGAEPYEGFNRLPISPDGLDDGDYWYDAAAFAAAFEDDDLLNAEFYLSDDGQTLRILTSAYPTEVTAGSDEGAIFFAYLYQVGVDPNAGFEPLYLNETDAYCRGYVFDLDAYIDWYIEDFNAKLVEQGKEPMTDEAEAKERADLREEISLYVLSFNPDAEKIKLAAEGQQIVFGSNSEMYAEIIPFITLFTSDNHEWGAWVADGAEETRTCVRCGETESRAAAGDKVLWAGYEEYNGVKTDNTVYVIAKKGAAKVQLRYAMGTVSYTRKNANATISDVIFDGYDCELWTISRELTDGDYVAVAKYGSTLLADIPDADGASFTVTTPAAQEPEVSSNVADAEIAGIENGVITFDGKTAQTITIRTGTDVQKVQLQSNIDGKTITFNANNAVVTEGTFGDGSPCLVWTITRIFTAGDYDFSINVRTQQNGLTDSGMDLVFTVV